MTLKQANLDEVDANAMVSSLFDIGMQKSDKERAITLKVAASR